MSKSYFEMIDVVNEAKTEREHDHAESRLSGWIECVEFFGKEWSGIDADRHTMRKYGDRPMCCGVLLDWMPNVEVSRPDPLLAKVRSTAGLAGTPTEDTK